MELKNNEPVSEQAVVMGLPHMTSFCCCMGLETGSRIIGFLHLAVSLSMMIVCAMFAEGARALAGTAEDAGDALYSTVHMGASIAAAGSALHALLAIMLIISAFKRYTRGLRVWVWAMAALSVAALVYLVLETALRGPSGSGSDIFLAFLEGALFFAVVAYCILCVNSYYLMLRSAEDMEGPRKTYY